MSQLGIELRVRAVTSVGAVVPSHHTRLEAEVFGTLPGLAPFVLILTTPWTEPKGKLAGMETRLSVRDRTEEARKGRMRGYPSRLLRALPHSADDETSAHSARPSLKHSTSSLRRFPRLWPWKCLPHTGELPCPSA